MYLGYNQIKGLIHELCSSNRQVPMCFQPHNIDEYISEPVNIVGYGSVMLSVCLLIEMVD